MKQIYTKCYSFEEANALGHFIMGKGYEGVQNDSYRYCEDHIKRALEYNRRHHREYCFVGVNGGCMVVGKNKKEMRRKLSMKYIEKERVFRELLSPALDFSQLAKGGRGMSNIKTLGDFRKITANLSDDFEIEMRIRRKLSDEEIKELAEKYGKIYPYPYETEYTSLEFDDIGYSDKVLCLGVEIGKEVEG